MGMSQQPKAHVSSCLPVGKKAQVAHMLELKPLRELNLGESQDVGEEMAVNRWSVVGEGSRAACLCSPSLGLSGL